MDLKTIDPKNVNITVAGKFRLRELIGKGSFGQIYRARIRGTEAVVAVKLEKKAGSSYLSLAKEARVISELGNKQGFPTLYAFGKEEAYNYMAVTLLGPNLEKLARTCGSRLSMKTVLMLADQVLTRVENLHNQGYIHRDIKPENFVMGVNDASKNLFLIDFGLARHYKDQNGKHIPLSDNKGLVGTARYASLNAHLGLEQSRRDDLESIGYMLIYLLKGKLPWQNTKAANKKEKYNKILDSKQFTTIESLCKNLPKEFAMYLNHVRGLEFQEAPNYKLLRKIFRMLFLESGFDYDYQYCWMKRQVTTSGGKSSKTAKFKVSGIDPTGLPETRRRERAPTFAKQSKNTLGLFRLESDVVEEEKGEESSQLSIKIEKQNSGLSPSFRPIESALENDISNGFKLKPGACDNRSNNSSRNSSKSLQISVRNRSNKQAEEDDIPFEIDAENAPSRRLEQASAFRRGVTMSPEIKQRFQTKEGIRLQDSKKPFKKQYTERPRLIDKSSVAQLPDYEHDDENISENSMDEWKGNSSLANMLHGKRTTMYNLC